MRQSATTSAGEEEEGAAVRPAGMVGMPSGALAGPLRNGSGGLPLPTSRSRACRRHSLVARCQLLVALDAAASDRASSCRICSQKRSACDRNCAREGDGGSSTRSDTPNAIVSRPAAARARGGRSGRELAARRA